MNRIVLIGNGFDLAHGLKTSYNDFFSYLWSKEIYNIQDQIEAIFARRYYSAEYFEYESDLFKLKISTEYNKYSKLNFYTLKESLISSYKTKIVLDDIILKKLIRDLSQEEITVFKNSFFKKITLKNNIQGWVDFEHEFFQELIKTKDVDLLNKEFEDIKNLFRDYLINEIKPKMDSLEPISHINQIIYSNCEIRDFSRDYKDEIIESIRKNTSTNWSVSSGGTSFDFENPNLKIIDNLKNNTHSFKPENILLLNFNYTHTESFYIHKDKEDDYFNNGEVNHIHGEAFKDDNPMIFGYGDERGSEYKELELINRNEYFDHIKSFAYLNAKNYKDLLEYINSEKYQIIILGHSCGLADRTLLNTLFEHKNCVSIKPYYHKNEEQNTDNYQTIVRNISRNFDDKIKMRELVVNKKFCEPFSLITKKETVLETTE